MTKKVNQIQIKTKVQNLKTIIGAQILFYCYNKDIWLNKSEFDTLLFIALNGYDKNTTLKSIVDLGIYKSEQCVRNTRNKLTRYGLLIEPVKRSFTINPEISIINSGIVLFDLKMINVEEK